MIDYLNGKLAEKYPTHIVVECSGIGYLCQISLNTFTAIKEVENCKILTHYSVNVDVRSGSSNHTLFGFATAEERELFRLLVTVSGVSANTARTILSSLNPGQLTTALTTEDLACFKAIKGIGPKLAQRIIGELKDKVGAVSSAETISLSIGNTTKEDALSALFALGFDKVKANKTITSILLKNGDDLPVETVIKLALQQL